MLKSESFPEVENGSGIFGRLLRRIDGCELRFLFDGKPDSDRVAIDDVVSRTRERMHLYGWREPVRGRVVLTPKGSSCAHNGLVVDLTGTVTMTTGEEEVRAEFFHQRRVFEAGKVGQPTPFSFEFAGAKEYESYRGLNAMVSYVVKATVMRSVKNVTQKEEVWVTRVDEETSESEAGNGPQHLSYFREETFGPKSVAMEVGVDNLIHIEFRYNKRVFHLNEQVLGKVTFKVADMDIQFGEVGLVRKEFLGPSGNEFESETLQRFEIMDGTPIVGEAVPIRLYLSSIPRLTPTYANVHDKFRVQYYLNLVLVTRESKRYFKQQEIVLYRRRGQEEPVNMDPLGDL